MRLHVGLLLALPSACLPGLAAAVPSPLDQQQPIPPQAWPEKPRWRKLSDSLIDAIWPHHLDHEHKTPDVDRQHRQPPPANLLARYGGDVVLRFNISSADEAQSLAEAADTLLLDIWEFTHDWVDIRLSMDIVAPLLGLLPASLQTAHTPLLRERELAQAIYDTYPASRSASGDTPFAGQMPSHLRNFNPFDPAPKVNDGPEGNLFFADYQPLSVIDPWMRLMSSLFTTHVRRIVVGKSHLGRDIAALRIGVHPTNLDGPQPKRKTIVIMAGLHAREWISTSTANFVAYNLITAYGKTPAITTLLEAFDFVFIPTVNPDGYAYTWESDRLWRKNRQPTSFRFCQGIDLDRSFGFQWDGLTTTAENPCSESYAGSAPFQAVESKALADWARNETDANNVEFVGLLDLHSYSQAILFPYSYSCSVEPPGLENLEELAYGLQKAIRVSHGHTYEAMPACEGNFAAASSSSTKKTAFPRMEASGGSALDFFHHDLGVRYSYQLKLRDRGTYGFLLPKGEIVPTGREIYDAVLYFAEFLRGVYEIDSESAKPVLKNYQAESGEELKDTNDREGEGFDLVPMEVVEGDADVAGEESMEEEAIVNGLGPQLELKRRRRR